MGLIGGTWDLDLECQMIQVIPGQVNCLQVADHHGWVDHNVVALTALVHAISEVPMEGMLPVLLLLESVQEIYHFEMLCRG